MSPVYSTTKHGVLGLFRSLRCTSFVQGVRVNMLLPYFIDTPILPALGKLMFAGGGMGKVEDVVDAGTRFVADSRILGRALTIGPKLRVSQEENGDWNIATGEDGREMAYWEGKQKDAK